MTKLSDIKRWSDNDIYDAWFAAFPTAVEHDVAILVALLEERAEDEGRSWNLGGEADGS